MKPQRSEVLAQGLIAGLLGYIAVVLFFVVVNVIGGRSPFHTAAVLGSTLFYGLPDPTQVAIEPGPILAYNGVHMLLSLILGTVGAWLLYETERHHFVWYFAFFIFLAGFILAIVFVGVVGAEITHALPWWSVVLANVVWAAVMGGYLWFMHRGLLAEIRAEEEAAE